MGDEHERSKDGESDGSSGTTGEPRMAKLVVSIFEIEAFVLMWALASYIVLARW